MGNLVNVFPISFALIEHEGTSSSPFALFLPAPGRSSAIAVATPDRRGSIDVPAPGNLIRYNRN